MRFFIFIMIIIIQNFSINKLNEMFLHSSSTTPIIYLILYTLIVITAIVSFIYVLPFFPLYRHSKKLDKELKSVIKEDDVLSQKLEILTEKVNDIKDNPIEEGSNHGMQENIENLKEAFLSLEKEKKELWHKEDKIREEQNKLFAITLSTMFKKMFSMRWELIN